MSIVDVVPVDEDRFCILQHLIIIIRSISNINNKLLVYDFFVIRVARRWAGMASKGG